MKKANDILNKWDWSNKAEILEAMEEYASQFKQPSLPIGEEVSIEELAKEVIDKRFTGIPIVTLELSAKHTAEHLLDNFNIIRKQTQPVSTDKESGLTNDEILEIRMKESSPSVSSTNLVQAICDKHEFVEVEYTRSGTDEKVYHTKCKNCGYSVPAQPTVSSTEVEDKYSESMLHFTEQQKHSTTSVKEEVKTTDFEKVLIQIEELARSIYHTEGNLRSVNKAATDIFNLAKEIKASQLHCTDGLDAVIEYINKMKFGTSYGMNVARSIKDKAKEIKATLNK